MTDRGTLSTPLILTCSVCGTDVNADERDETICIVCGRNLLRDLLLSIRNNDRRQQHTPERSLLAPARRTG